MPPRKRSKACFPAPPTMHTIEVKFATGPGSIHGLGYHMQLCSDPARLLQELLDQVLGESSNQGLWGVYASASVAGQSPTYSFYARDSVYNPDRSSVELRYDLLGGSYWHVDTSSVTVNCNVKVSKVAGAVKIFWGKCPEIPIAVLRQNPFGSRHPLGSFTFEPVSLPSTSYLQVNRVYTNQVYRSDGMPLRRSAWISGSNMTIFLLCVQRITSLPRLPEDLVRMVLEPAVYEYEGPYRGTQVIVEFVPRKSVFSDWTVKKLVKHLRFWNRMWKVSDDLDELRKPELIERAESAMTRAPIARVVQVYLTNLWFCANIPFGPMQGLDPQSVYHHPCA